MPHNYDVVWAESCQQSARTLSNDNGTVEGNREGGRALTDDPLCQDCPDDGNQRAIEAPFHECPLCGTSLDHPLDVTHAADEFLGIVAQYLDNAHSHIQRQTHEALGAPGPSVPLHNSPSSESASSDNLSSSPPEVIDLTGADETNFLGSVNHIVHSWTGRRQHAFGRGTSWSEEDRVQLYRLKCLFDISDEDTAAVLTQIGGKRRKVSAIKAQFGERSKSHTQNARISQDLENMVAAGNLHCYSDTLAALRKAAVSLNIDLKLKTTIQIPTIQASPSSSSRKRRYRHEISDDDSWVPSNRYEHDEDGGDFELRRRNSRPSSKLLFRVYSKYSHGISSNQGHWAGAFANSRLIPPLNEAELPGLDESLASHLKSEEVPGGSPFISTTDSFLWVLTKSAKMKGRTRISVIDRTKVQYPITHMAGAYRRLKDAGLLEGIERYYGNFEFLVYGGVSEDAIIHDFSVHEFKNFVDDGFYRMQVVCPEIVFNRRGSTPKKKRKDIADINLSRNRSLVAIDQLSAFVLANVADKSLQDDFKQNLKLNWELEKRCSGDV